MEAVETIVIGAGLAGASVAAHLDSACLVLEQGSQPAAEASAQNAGMVRLLVEDPVERRLSVRAAERLAQLDRDWEQAPSRVTGAVLALVHDPAHLDDGVAHLRAMGVAIEACDDPAAHAPALRRSPIQRAWWLPDARVADPHALVTGLLARSRATLRCGVQVQGLQLDGGRVTGVRTDAGTLPCHRVVVAAGAWSGHFAAQLGLRRPLVPIRRSLHQTHPHPLAAASHPWCWLDDVGLYVRPEGGGWLVSGCDETVDPLPQGPGSTGQVAADWQDRVVDRLLHYLPALGDASLRGGWTGLRTFAPDRRPILGPDPDVAGLHWAAGLGGYGVTTHLAVGEAVAAWVDGRSVDFIEPADVDPGRAYPRRWPIRPAGGLRGMRLVPG